MLDVLFIFKVIVVGGWDGWVKLDDGIIDLIFVNFFLNNKEEGINFE